MSAQIPPAELKYYQEHASDNQQPNLIATIVLCLVLPCIAVFLRFLVRWRTKAGFKADDWLILLALVMMDLPCLSVVVETALTDITTASMRRYVHDYWSWRSLRRRQAHNIHQ
jgi:hypothetical protein